jgi:hypothetical protein
MDVYLDVYVTLESIITPSHMLLFDLYFYLYIVISISISIRLSTYVYSLLMIRRPRLAVHQ